MSELKITIVTAVYNGEKYIEECIKSIMNQTYQNFEHIIMDGGSTDNTLEIANANSARTVRLFRNRRYIHSDLVVRVFCSKRYVFPLLL